MSRAPGLVPAILVATLLACTCALAFVKTGDSDAFTHLALGRNLVAERGFPSSEPFSFPGAGLPYYNPEWLFDLVLYGAWAVAGFAGAVALKAALAALAAAILFRHSLLPEDPPSHRRLGIALAAMVVLAALPLLRDRFVERPDLPLMVFLAFTAYALDSYIVEGRRWLYALPALQLVWVNMHPSIVVGTIPFVAHLAGGGFQALLRRWRGITLPSTPSPRQLRVIALVFVGVLAAALLNPYGVSPFWAPFRLMENPWFREEVVELQPPTFPADLAAFLVIALLGIAFLTTIRHPPITAMVQTVTFAYLALSAKRFLVLLAIAATPVLACHLRRLARRLVRPDWAGRLVVPAAAFAVATGVVVTWLSLAGIGRLADPMKTPGLGIDEQMVPEGALRYLDGAGVTGRVLNTFHMGGYITWRDFPRRLAIVDGRGHLPPGLLDELRIVRFDAARLERLRATYGLDVAVLSYPIDDSGLAGETDVDLGLSAPGWALVYWDDVALVYLRRDGRFREVIERDEYRLVRPANGGYFIARKLKEGSPPGAIEAELRRNVEKTHSSRAYSLLGSLYNEVGRPDEAIAALIRVRATPFDQDALYHATFGLGIAHELRGDLGRAIDFYRKTLRFGNDPMVLYNLGHVLAEAGRDRDAIRYFEQALALNPDLTPVYSALLESYRRLGMGDRAWPVQAEYPRALTRERAAQYRQQGERLNFEGRYDDAARAFLASLRLNPRNAPGLSGLGAAYTALGRASEAFSAQQQALVIDPGFAPAHYRLAELYERMGERAKARQHYAAYVRLDPRGYWSRRAREKLARLNPDSSSP